MSSRSFWRNEADKIRNDRSAVDTSELFANPWEEEDAGESGFVTGQQFLNITKQQPTTVMALVGFNDKGNYNQAYSMYKGNLGYIVKNACKKAEEIYTSNGLNVRFYPLSLKETLAPLDNFNGLYVGFMGLNPFSDTNHGTTGSSRWTSSIGMGDVNTQPTGDDVIAHSTSLKASGCIGYNLAHEYLHQWLARAEYILYKNILHMQNTKGGHLNLKNFPNLNTAGNFAIPKQVDVYERASKKQLGYWRIWTGHLYVLKHYNSLCNEILNDKDFEKLDTKLLQKLNNESKRKEYQFRINQIKKGIELRENDPYWHDLPNPFDYEFTDKEILEIVFNFQF
jgi:hypothetical protein